MNNLYPLLPPTTAPYWSGDLCELKCVAVREETHDVKTFEFKPRLVTGALFRYAPGQFITLALNIGDDTVRRCYTLSSSPARPYTATITVKRSAGGLVSNWLHDRLRRGDIVEATGPSGDFSCLLNPSWNNRYLFLSAGSGITPMLSMLRCLIDLQIGSDVVFVHHASNDNDRIAMEELLSLQATRRNLAVHYVTTRAGNRPNEPSGRVSAAQLERLCPDFASREVFVCGPGGYTATVLDLLHQSGFDLRRYHTESFSFDDDAGVADSRVEPLPTQPDERVAAQLHRVTLSYRGRRETFLCPQTTTILEAARNSGLSLPSSCRKGVCGTCKARCRSGKTEMREVDGLLERERSSGFRLLCSTYARSDVELEI